MELDELFANLGFLKSFEISSAKSVDRAAFVAFGVYDLVHFPIIILNVFVMLRVNCLDLSID